MYANPLLIVQAMYSTSKGQSVCWGISENHFFVTYLEGSVRIGKDLEELKSIWKNLEGFVRIKRFWKDLEGSRRMWKDWKGSGRSGKDLEGLKRI